MRISKKIIISAIIFIVIIAIETCFFDGFYFNSESEFYFDKYYRQELSGSLDYLICGSSEGLTSFVPNIIDKELDVTSYNLSGCGLSVSGREELLKQEIKRNNIDTVVLPVDSGLFGIEEHKYSEGDMYLIPRLNSTSERALYFLKNVNIKDYLAIISKYNKLGTEIFINKFLGKEIKSNVDKSSKGFYPQNINDKTLTTQQILLERNTKNVELNNKIYIKDFENLIKWLNSQNINVVMVMAPYSENRMWVYSNLEDVYSIFKKISTMNNCQFIDFNLIKNRSAYFSDKNSFSDVLHTSHLGAESFTKLFCETMIKIEKGIDVSNLFYSSYDEAIKHMDYYKKYQELTKEQ